MVGKEAMKSNMKFRLSDELKEKILAYCEQYDMSVSAFIRDACEKIFQEEGEK